MSPDQGRFLYLADAEVLYLRTVIELDVSRIGAGSQLLESLRSKLGPLGS